MIFFFYSQRLLVSTNLLMFLLTSGMCSGLLLILHFPMGKSFFFLPLFVCGVFMSVIEMVGLVPALTPPLQLPGAALSPGAAIQIEAELHSLVPLEVELSAVTGQVPISHLIGAPHLLPQLVAVIQSLAKLSDMASGETANTLPEVETCAWRRSFLAMQLTLRNNTRALILKNMMISPSRLLALVCPSPFFHSPALLWILSCWKTLALPCTPLLLPSKNIQSLSSLAEGI